MLVLLGTAVTVAVLTITRYLQDPTFSIRVESLHPFVEFPSVSVCPEIAFREEKMDHFVSKMRFPPGWNASYIREVLPQLAAFYSPDVKYSLHHLQRIEDFLEYNRLDVETVARGLTTSCEETFIKCRWNRIMKNCSKLFHMELTADGFCCVFNGRSLRREMKEYDTNLRNNKNKWYNSLFGFTSGLMLAVNQTQRPSSIDLAYKWVALQTSQHFVDTTNNGTPLNPGSEQWIAFHTRSFRIAQVAKELSFNLRKCKMPYERLQYFPIYNRRYCILECEIANTLRNCNCVRATHPRPPGASYCRARSLLCAKHAMVSMGSESCKCPRTCIVETVYLRISNLELIDNSYSDSLVDGFYEGLDPQKVTIVRVYMQNRLKKSMERWSSYGYIDLFAQLGGVFNVFFGCSVLTMLGLLQIIWRMFVNSKFYKILCK